MEEGGQADAGSSKSAPLAGERLLLAADHYDAHVLDLLKGFAESLGAEVTTDREVCTMMIVNFHSPKWEAEREHLKYLETSFPHLRQPVLRSYHWLIMSAREERVVDLEELTVQEPFMFHPSEPHYPVKVWVSKNITRNVGESAEDAHQTLIRDLESVGAVSVVKRAYADVLVVDKNSRFYDVVKRERQSHGRSWQKVAERDWAEACLSNQTAILHTRGEEDVESDGQDSFVEEEPAPTRTGPGRPTGK